MYRHQAPRMSISRRPYIQALCHGYSPPDHPCLRWQAST
jgi:hypothetical protein